MSDQPIKGLSALFDPRSGRLPINRKERYYTGTVLPMIVAADGFSNLHKFLELCGVPADMALDADPGATNIQFFTEYGFQESLRDGAGCRFEDPEGNDTPDLVVYVESRPSLLLGVEAKVFSRPSASALRKQLRRQKKLLAIMADGAGTRTCPHQVALLPQELGITPEQIDCVPVLHWQTVAAEFREDADPYWIRVLKEALSRYCRLKSPPSSGLYCDDKIRGAEILDLAESRTYTWMGRRGGISGKELEQDIQSGNWREQVYEVRQHPLRGKSNWFPIADFIKKIELSSSHGGTP